MNYKNIDELEVIAMAQNADELAMEFLLEKYTPLLAHICDKYYLKDGDKDDLMQEARIGFVQSLKDFKVESGKSFKNFAYLCVKRELDTCIKRSNRKKHAVLNDAVSLNIKSDDDYSNADALELESMDKADVITPEHLFVEKESLSHICATMAKILSKLEYRVLLMRMQGYSYNEITLLLQLENKSVDNAMQRIRKKVTSTNLVSVFN